MSYIPKPIDTSAVQLPDDLLELAERLAKNAHDVWARRKLDDQWTLGPLDDKDGKKHPDLIPYERLSEDKKQYDRDIATETIKAILALGYAIGKPGSQPAKA